MTAGDDDPPGGDPDDPEEEQRGVLHVQTLDEIVAENEETECAHGVPVEYECEECGRTRHGEPGQVGVSAVDLDRGLTEFEYLTSHGPDSVTAFLRIPEGLTPLETQRLIGLCHETPLELYRGIATASKQNAEDFERVGPKSLFAFLASRANYTNHLPGRAFAFASSGEPFWFAVHDVILGKTRRGKGRHLVFLRNLLTAVLDEKSVREVARFSLAGLFGTIDKDGKWTASEILEANHGILLFPEFANVNAIFGGSTGGEAPGVVADFLSSGRYTASLKAGSRSYTSYAYWIAACQPSFWDSISKSVVGITGRCVLSELPDLTDEQERERVLEPALGHNLDPLALLVFAAKVRRIFYELKPTSFDVGEVQRRLHALMLDETSLRVYLRDDLQRHVSLTLGAYLATAFGPLDGDIVLPDPWSIPDLKAAIEEDARVRGLLAVDPGERLIRRIDGSLWTSGFASKTPRDRDELTVYLSLKIGEDPGAIRTAIVGSRRKSYSSLIERRILRVVDPDLDQVRADLKTALEAEPESRRNDPEVLKEIAARLRAEHAKGGRPRKLYLFVPPESRFFRSKVEPDEGEAEE